LALNGSEASAGTEWADRLDIVHATTRDAHWRIPGVGEIPIPAMVLIRPDGYVAWASTDTEWPQQVVEDRGEELRVLLTPGTRGLGPVLWIKSMRDNDPGARGQLLEAYARREWEMADWIWERNTRLAIMYTDRYFAIEPMWNERGEFHCWYVNFQLPFTRTAGGVDTSDLHLDLIVDPDHTYRWKDEDEYALAIRLGLVPGEWQQAVETARHQALGMVERRAGPFGEDWSTIPV
jgi:protein associated with RNAse G/E